MAYATGTHGLHCFYISEFSECLIHETVRSLTAHLNVYITLTPTAINNINTHTAGAVITLTLCLKTPQASEQGYQGIHSN